MLWQQVSRAGQGLFCLGVLALGACHPPEAPPTVFTVQQDVENTPRLKELDFTPFESALAALDPQRRRELDGLVADATCRTLQEQFEAGQLTSFELTVYFLDRIRRFDGLLRSYVELNPHCLEEAMAADRKRKERRQSPGFLHGIPISVKDNIGTAAPLHTTAGSEILLHWSPPRDARLVTCLREQGVVILGKTSLSELAGAMLTQAPGFNAISGQGRNPHGKSLPVLGSSSGSAIATAAWLTFLSVGTETSGSVLAPASVNGVVGMKPSLGRMAGEGVVPLIRFQDSAGPLARTVEDAAVLLQAMDETDDDLVSGLATASLRGLRLGLLRASLLSGRAAGGNRPWLERAETGLREAGAVLSGAELRGEVPLISLILVGLSEDTLGYMKNAGAPVASLKDLVGYNKAMPERRIPRGQNLLIMADALVTDLRQQEGKSADGLAHAYEQAALELRAQAAAALEEAMQQAQAELLVSLGNQHATFYATAGFPAVTVPLGRGGEGSLCGITFIGRRGEDARVLAAAHAFEQAAHLRVEPGEPFRLVR